MANRWFGLVWDSRDVPKHPNPFHFRGSVRNPNHRAPNHQLAISGWWCSTICAINSTNPFKVGPYQLPIYKAIYRGYNPIYNW